ncbi:MAG: DegT/DnrJ/EryC1/StrS family aminotransferase, partial [Spirochaetaceae bacterium]
RHALAVSSATAGLHLALEAVGVTAGSRVITSPYTFAASSEVIRYLDADPLFVDVRDDDLNIDPDAVEEALVGSDRVSAVLPIHIGGRACAIERIVAAAAERSVPVVEDAAHAFPAATNGRSLGTWGSAGVFSFYATKTITTGEGGMLVTDDDALARRASVLRLHGIDRDVWDRYTSDRPSWEYRIVDVGFKYNMPDLLAAIGRVQLTRAESFLAGRRRVAAIYARELADADYLQLPDTSDSACHLYVVRVRSGRLSITRDELMHRLADLGIGTSLHYIPLHLMPYYAQRYGFSPADFPVSLDAYQRAVSLPIYPDLTDEEAQRVTRTIRSVCESHLAP